MLKKKKKNHFLREGNIYEIIAILVLVSFIIVNTWTKYFPEGINIDPLLMFDRRMSTEQIFIPDVDFEDDDSDVYVRFKVVNLFKSDKFCLFNIKVEEENYTFNLSLLPRSVQHIRKRVDMPYGETDVTIDYNCT
ncbi:hypothetical protein JXB41_03190 [Candidatus Woesearchaeota archaeon]|nr:hypothetical protein [Candidatus Woesearchaeota archaeon]